MTGRWIILIVFCLVCMPLYVLAEKQTLYYAGFAYLADCDEVADRYKYANKAIGKENGCGPADFVEAPYAKTLSEINSSSSSVNLTVNLGDSQSGDAISLAIGLDGENVSVYQLRDRYVVHYDLTAQILTFDFTNKEIVGAYPVFIRFGDLLDEPPTEEQRVAVFKKMLLDQDFGANLIDEFVRVAKNIRPQQRGSLYFKVGDVNLAPRALEYLDSQNKNPEVYKTWVAQAFSKAFSSRLNMPVLPYTKGQAIGAKMALQFSDGLASNFDVPPASYLAEITIRGMIKKTLGENDYLRKLSYIIGLGLKFEQPDMNEVYLSQNFQKGRVRDISKEQGEPNSWAEFEESLSVLFDQVAEQVEKKEKKWIKDHTPKNADVKSARKELDAFYKKVVDLSR